MRLLKWAYKTIKKKEAPYYYDYSLWTIICKPIRKWATNVLAANCPFNTVRLLIYRLCGFKIGKGTFIGMRCYLDDMCYDLLSIGSDCIISYGVFFACHGKNQEHVPISIEDGVYIGMRASIISRNTDRSKKGIRIGRDAIIGACTLVNKDVPPGATAVGVPCRIITQEECNR